MRTLFLAWCASAFVLFAGCSSATPGGGGPLPAACVAAGIRCGLIDGEAPLDCGVCRFDRRALEDGGFSPSLASGPKGVVMAYALASSAGGDVEVRLARETTDGFSFERVGAVSDPAVFKYVAPSVALANDGVKAWVAYASSDGGVVVASSTGAGSTSEVVGAGVHPSVAVDTAGAPHVAYVRRGSPNEVRHTFKARDVWMDELVESSTVGVGVPHLLLDAAGAVHVLYVSNGFRHATRGSGGFSVEVVEPGTSVANNVSGGAVGAAFDANGNLHATWPQGDLRLSYGVRRGSAWSVLTRITYAPSSSALALDGAGHPFFVFHDYASGQLGQFSGEKWVLQDVTRCASGAMAIAFDVQGALRVVHDCQGLALMTLNGVYPASYRADCDQVTKQACSAACACGADAGFASGSQCPFTTGLSSNAFGCEALVHGRVCGDASQPPEPVAPCAASIQTSVCLDGPDRGLKVADVCVPLFSR